MENSDTFEKLLHDYKKMKAALEDIVNWNDKLEFEYDDIGQRAKIGLGIIDQLTTMDIAKRC